MLGKTSVSMMVLLLAASLIGISSIHQYIEGQKPPAKTPLAGSTSRVVGEIVQVTSYAPVAGCITSVILAKNIPSPPGVQPGDSIILFSERESTCVLLGVSKMIGSGNEIIGFNAQKMTASSLPPVLRVALGLDKIPPVQHPNLYRLFSLDTG
jgi:hypothetical protein